MNERYLSQGCIIYTVCLQKGVKMQNFNTDTDELITQYLKSEGISRRDAMKMLGVGVTTLGSSSALAATPAKAASAKGKIVIIGGGLAGVCSAARLCNMLENPDITIIEPNDISVSYQPGQTLIATGLYEYEDIIYQTKEFMPDCVKWIKDVAVDVDANSNKVQTKQNGTISYDYLIVAAGVVNDYSQIKGLEDVGEVLTLDNKDAQRANKVFGKDGLNTIYYAKGSAAMWPQLQNFVQDAKNGKKLKGVFPEPHTAFKCGGSQKKIIWLTHARLLEASKAARENVTLDFYTNKQKLFGVPLYNEAIKEHMHQKDINVNYSHKLVEVDPSKKIAVFQKHWIEEVYDEFLEMKIDKTFTQKVETDYDFIHVIPANKVPDDLANSSIGSAAGWIPVDQYTLQHTKYENIFSLGDVAAIPLGKTGGSIRKQYKVLCDNLVAHMQGKQMSAKYNGYTVCPLITDIGKVMLAEFKWNPDGGTPIPAPSFPLAPEEDRWLYWLMKVYLLKPLTIYGMLSGRA